MTGDRREKMSTTGGGGEGALPTTKNIRWDNTAPNHDFCPTDRFTTSVSQPVSTWKREKYIFTPKKRKKI